MSSRPQIDTPENWNAASLGYSRHIAPKMMEPFANEFIDRLNLNANVQALEVAAGSGALTTTLARNVGSLFATDFSPKMINLLKSRISSAGITNVSVAVMDGQALELEDNKVDRAACSFGLMLFPDRHKGFKELHRVVRRGGRAAVSGWGGPDKFEALGLFLKAIQQAYPNLPRPSSPPPVFSLADIARFKREMEDAGFKNVVVEYVTRELTLNSFEDMWSMLTVGAPPVKVLFDKVGPEGQSRIQEALAEIIQNRFGNGRITISNTATFGSGNVI